MISCILPFIPYNKKGFAFDKQSFKNAALSVKAIITQLMCRYYNRMNIILF